MSKLTKEVNEYLLKIQQGDSSQYEPLFNLTALHLRGVAYTYLKNKSLDEDVVAETFLRIINYNGAYKFDHDGYNWMCKITQNVAITFNNTEKNVAYLECKVTNELPLSRCDDYGDLDFFKYLQGLSAVDKKIAIEKFYYGKTFREIAAQFNVSSTAIFHRIKKIYKIIKKNLKK